jgi:N6-adenosine-specific RNA methylase IME4/ParB-like chromosome segregation protein Spo0J
MFVAINSITTGPRLREPSPEAVAVLAESMARLGLLAPIVVTPTHVLVAGAHRLAAARSLGWSTIAANVLDIDERAALLAEIDENLVRNELTTLERCEHLAERKRVFEAMHPKAKRGGDRRSAKYQADKLAVRSFSETTSDQIGESSRNIRRQIAIAEALNQGTRDAIRAMPLANNAQELKRLAKLPEADRGAVVAQLADGARSVKEAQRRVVAKAIRAEAPPLPTGPSRVIVIDPPWDYSNRKSDPSHGGALDYPSMPIEKIAALPVPELAFDDAVLWMWTTNAHLEAAQAIVKAYGFEAKTVLTWAKNQIGMGDWLRGQTEHCIMAVRGRPVVELAGQSTLLTAKRREHSRKPEEFYSLVESLCPGSKVELFARQPREGWATWGAEADRFAAK